MTQSIPVRCLLDRYWEPDDMDWKGTTVNGMLIDITSQTAEDLSGKLIPVGIVLVEDNTFQCVPMEFITCNPETVPETE